MDISTESISNLRQSFADKLDKRNGKLIRYYICLFQTSFSLVQEFYFPSQPSV